MILEFLSTLSLRRATKAALHPGAHPVISIHALLAESDYSSVCPVAASCRISIHALLAESDGRVQGLFQQAVHFYPRSPCGERRHVLSAELR